MTKLGNTMMKTKEIVLYNDSENYKREEETRNYLFENYAEDNDWACKENISDEDIYKEIEQQNQEAWQDLKDALESSFKHYYYIMTGTCGRWDGKYSCGTFIKSFSDFQQMIQHLDHIKVTDKNGHLIVEGYHHDGNDRYELKRLTRQGYEFASNNHFAHDRQLHYKIMSCNLFSALPRLAKKVYGL